MAKLHDFASSIIWTGNRGEGTRTYKGYDRTWDIALPGKGIIHRSNDPLLGEHAQFAAIKQFVSHKVHAHSWMPTYCGCRLIDLAIAR